jgi:hypothetical protein
MTNQSKDDLTPAINTTSSSTPTAKTVSLTPPPSSRSDMAKGFLAQNPETLEEPVVAESPSKLNDELGPVEGFLKDVKKTKAAKNKKLSSGDRKHKAAVRYMQQQGIEDVESIDYTRLNCDIPSDLHNWLNMYSRSGGEYSSMTEIAIEVLGNFAKEYGFKVGKK